MRYVLLLFILGQPIHMKTNGVVVPDPSFDTKAECLLARENELIFLKAMERAGLSVKHPDTGQPIKVSDISLDCQPQTSDL